MSSPDDLMSVREAADLAGKSLSTVRDWIRAGHLVKHREDPEDDKSKVLVSRAELVARIEEVGGPPTGPGGSHPSTAPDADLVAELASTRAVITDLEAGRDQLVLKLADMRVSDASTQARADGLEERLRLVNELREAERVRLEAAVEVEREGVASLREAFEKGRVALEAAAEAHLGAADAERRRADAAEEALRQTRDDLEVSRGELVAMRAELEALRVRNGLSWWRRMLTAGPAS
jgi:hypothetical protein